MDTKLPNAGSLRPIELGVRRLGLPDLLQIDQAHFFIFHVRCLWNYVCEITKCTFWEIFGIFFLNYWKRNAQFICKHLSLHDKRIAYVRIVLYLYILRFVACFKDCTWQIIKLSFKLLLNLFEGNHMFGTNPLCEFSNFHPLFYEM